MARIAFISNTAESIVNFRGPLIRDMVGLGHEVIALAPDHDASTLDALNRMSCVSGSFSLSRTGMNPAQDVKTIISVARALRKFRPDVAIARSVKPVVYGLQAARLAGVPHNFALLEGLGFVYTESGTKGLVKRMLRTGLDFLFRSSLRIAEKTIFLNPDDMAEFQQRRLVPPGRAVLIRGIGVPLDEWPLLEPKIDPPCYVFVGRLLREKGITEFVEAARIVRAKIARSRFVLLGSIDSNPSSVDEGTVRGWVDEGLVEWPGFVDPRDWFREATAFVLPSYREGVPRSTQEAMASGLPIITTDVPGCRETVIDGRNGFLVPARNAPELANSMIFLAENPTEVRKMGAASRKLAEEWFDIRSINTVFLETLGLRTAGRIAGAH
ncbi:glycosyltransferase family 4 protein [Thermaurantiacus sp.]